MARSSSIRPLIIIKTVFVLLYTYGVLFTSTEACDGYKIKINKLEPCAGNIFKLTNPKVDLTKACRAVITGCMDVKGFSSCKVTYDIKKKGMMVPFKGEKDACEEIAKATKESDTASRLKKYNISPNCPIKSVNACSKEGESLDLSPYKDKFRLAAGQYTGTIGFDCDSGKSCFKFDVEFKRGK
ncbi:uncharacterized protein LOC110834292 [Zootermopsis nevadensis]|uniref:Uncharacterized protein n=1 Tax=Zootermopsis nevadensis TaxID=136037 RepID=A0A067QWJ5_ZOONE|nr:uncharacterized protein LOC110834292 [Zootermopsis nevadensis]KDR14704.1 hypothetical protein L798_11477 [Zootermopsis nevadensis]